MRGLFGVSLLALSLALIGAAHAGDTWFRLGIGPTINFSEVVDGVPDLGSNDNIAITVVAKVDARVYGDLVVPVMVSGIDGSYIVTVNGLPGATWAPDPGTYGVYGPGMRWFGLILKIDGSFVHASQMAW